VTWLPSDFTHPARVDLSSGHHLRPIAEADLELDYPAVMGSRERLWEIYGEAWGWPPPSMTLEQDRAELAWHAEEMVTGRSFNYAVFDHDESALLGCVYIDPPTAAAAPATDTRATNAPAADATAADATAADATAAGTPAADDSDRDAIVSWWVVDREVGGQLEAALGDAIPRWLAEEWPFVKIRYGV
jgi:hypothetical protein